MSTTVHNAPSHARPIIANIAQHLVRHYGAAEAVAIAANKPLEEVVAALGGVWNHGRDAASAWALAASAKGTNQTLKGLARTLAIIVAEPWSDPPLPTWMTERIK